MKGSLSALDVARAIGEGWHHIRPGDHVQLIPMADGGEGTLDALEEVVPQAERRSVGMVTGPGGQPTPATYLQLPEDLAVVELAEACGLPLLDRPAPLSASSFGLGEVIKVALADGARSLLVALGGSASTDGGVGALASLGARFFGQNGSALLPGGGSLAKLERVDLSELVDRPAGGVEVLVDVKNPLLGPEGAAATFGPQKGATAADVSNLERGLNRLVTLMGGQPEQPGAGAAGGVAYGFATAWHATLTPGSSRIADLVALEQHLPAADLIICGEGRFDPTSLGGKAVGHILRLGADYETPVAIVAGSVDPIMAKSAAAAFTLSLSDLAGSTEASMSDPRGNLHRAGSILARRGKVLTQRSGRR